MTVDTRQEAQDLFHALDEVIHLATEAKHRNTTVGFGGRILSHNELKTLVKNNTKFLAATKTKLYEIMGYEDNMADIIIDGFVLHREKDDGVVSNYIVVPGKNEILVDFNGKQIMNANMFKVFVSFYKKHNRFPGRRDIGSGKAIGNESLNKIVV